MDTDEKPQSSHRATGGKGRHHAWDKHIVKRDRSQATFGKFIVNPEKLTKKQVARLTRINDDQSEFAINVMYSLNRKYRWEQLWGAGNAIEADADVFPDNVKVDGCDGAYALAHDVVIKGHYERTDDGNVESTTNRAFWLADPAHHCIRRNKDKPLDEDGKAIPEVRYVQAATTDKRYADFKHLTWNTPWQWKRGKMFHRFELDQWGDDAAKGHQGDDRDPKTVDGGPDNDDGDDDDTESTPPRPNTFTLADFVVDNRSPPTASLSELTLASYDDLTDSVDIGADYTSLVDVKGLCKDSFFTEFTCDGSQLGCSDAAFESLESSNFAFQWLNLSKTSCVIDLSEKLHPAEQDVVAVIVIEQLKSKKLRVLLNGLFPIDEESLLKSFDLTHFDSLPEFLETCTTKLSKSYETSCLSTTRDAYDCQSTFHPKALIDASSINPQTPPKFYDINKVSDIADGFEIINLGKTETSSCAKCGSSEAPVYQAFTTCFHNFCRNCLQSELTTAIECHKASPLKCLKTACTALVRDEFLYVLLPLPVANFYFNEQLKQKASVTGKKLIECPHCESMATNSPPKFNSLACWNCSMCFCLRCKSRPHFPLTCEQFASWAIKFELQYYLELSRKNPDSVRTCVCGSIMYQAHDKVHLQTCQDCGTEYYWSWRYKKGDQSVKLVNFADENTPNFISAEYSNVCLPIHELRFNVKAASDLKSCLSRAEMDANHVQQFVLIFKLALHLIELGFAWLYLTRAQKTSKWSTLKAHLTQLRSLVDSVMTSVKQELPLVEPNQKVAEMKKLVDATMNLYENV